MQGMQTMAVAQNAEPVKANTDIYFHVGILILLLLCCKIRIVMPCQTYT